MMMIWKSSLSAATSATEVFKVYWQTCAKKCYLKEWYTYVLAKSEASECAEQYFLGWKMGICVQIFAKWEAFNWRLSLALEMSILERDKSTSYHFLFVTRERKEDRFYKSLVEKFSPPSNWRVKLIFWVQTSTDLEAWLLFLPLPLFLHIEQYDAGAGLEF